MAKQYNISKSNIRVHFHITNNNVGNVVFFAQTANSESSWNIVIFTFIDVFGMVIVDIVFAMLRATLFN